jgi:ATP-dependent protease HslVU (ClpYQ) ATPase subunit
MHRKDEVLRVKKLIENSYKAMRPDFKTSIYKSLDALVNSQIISDKGFINIVDLVQEACKKASEFGGFIDEIDRLQEQRNYDFEAASKKLDLANIALEELKVAVNKYTAAYEHEVFAGKENQITKLFLEHDPENKVYH